MLDYLRILSPLKLFYFAYSAILLLTFYFPSALAADYVVNQKNKQFDKKVLLISKGDTVNFLNSDRFFHNIYSLSEAQTFDLGSYPKGQSKSVQFTNPGTVEIRCAIHPTMQMRIEVSE